MTCNEKHILADVSDKVERAEAPPLIFRILTKIQLRVRIFLNTCVCTVSFTTFLTYSMR